MAERRKSKFGQGSSIAPVSPAPQEEPQGPAVAAASAIEAPDTAAPAEKAPAASEGAAEKKVKVGFYMLPSEKNRARAAWMNTIGHTGHTSITLFYEAAIAEYTRQLEREHNDSRPFS